MVKITAKKQKSPKEWGFKFIVEFL